MSMTYTSQPASSEAAAYGGMVDAVGGIATIVLAIIALSGTHPDILLPIAVIVFGAALMIEAGTMVSEYAQVIFPAGGMAPTASFEQSGGGSVSTLFLVGAAGIVLGVLALIGIQDMILSAIAILAFGGALIVSSNSVRQLYLMQSASHAGMMRSGGEFLAGEMASGSAGVQVLAGIATIILGILALAGTYPAILILAALIVLGATIILTGSALSGLVISFMRTVRTTGTSRLPAE